NGATVTVLGQAPSGIADLGWWATIGLSVTGSNPVKLVGSANGVAKVIVNDSSASAITAAGAAGMWTDLAGIWFRDFTVSGGGAAGGSDGGTPHAAPPPPGPTDAVPPDARPPDAGPPDAGPPDAGPPTVIFSDNFKIGRASCRERVLVSGAWGTRETNQRAESDLDGSDQAVVQDLVCGACW